MASIRPFPDIDESGDVGGQKTLRTYWRNYFEKTDTLIWVVDSTDRERIDDCRQELAGLLLEEVRSFKPQQIPDNQCVLEVTRSEPYGLQEQG